MEILKNEDTYNSVIYAVNRCILHNNICEGRHLDACDGTLIHT